MKRAGVPRPLLATVVVLFVGFAALGYRMAHGAGGVSAREAAVVSITGAGLGLLAWVALGSRRR